MSMLIDNITCKPSKLTLTIKWATFCPCIKRKRKPKIRQKLTLIPRGPLRRSKRLRRINIGVEVIKFNHLSSNRRSFKAFKIWTLFTNNKFKVWQDWSWEMQLIFTMVRRKLLLRGRLNWLRDSRLSWKPNSSCRVTLIMAWILLWELEEREKNWFKCLCINTRTILILINLALILQTMAIIPYSKCRKMIVTKMKCLRLLKIRRISTP